MSAVQIRPCPFLLPSFQPLPGGDFPCLSSCFSGMVQFHMPKGNTFQAGAMGTNNHNSLSKQELRRKWQLGGTEKCYPVLNHAVFLVVTFAVIFLECVPPAANR